ncbi:hypothetical protein LAZ67_20002081 [Cordylochernes scorpioides]|uniref:Mos1 transposase HTH domain-containing protein n=1 Tax=Cordylochernes scorpioides TaxID=51811 RepID=A0ABY6LMV4_9ARAC|nr:hypothetical protein LAZ67_20002081 [Cordylochernes scorpioides]
MSISEPKSAHLREVLLFAFNWKKSATEAHRMLEEVYSDHALSKSQCYRWFKNSKVAILNLIMNHMENRPKRETRKTAPGVSRCCLSTFKQPRNDPKAFQMGLLARHEKKSFLHRIVTSDEKWIHFSNPTRQKSWGLPANFQNRRLGPIASEKRQCFEYAGETLMTVLEGKLQGKKSRGSRLQEYTDDLKQWTGRHTYEEMKRMAEKVWKYRVVHPQ